MVPLSRFNGVVRITFVEVSRSRQWSIVTGTGIQLFGNASQASYNLTLDGTPTQANSSSPTEGLLVDLHDLSDGNHTVTLTMQTSSSPSADEFLDFDKALITF